MDAHEQPDAYGERLLAPRVDRNSPVVMAATAAAFTGVLLALASWGGSYSYQTIAQLEGIRDARAGQVTGLFAASLLLVWVIGIVLLGVSGRKSIDRSSNLADAMLRSPTHRRFIASTVGICVLALLTGATLIAVAHSPTIVVTPPAAWLIMMAAGGLGGAAAVRLTDEFARPRSNPTLSERSIH